MSTPENIRYHAAGHLAAASLLAKSGQGLAAAQILRVILEYVDSPKVDAPSQLREKLREAVNNPVQSQQDIELLEKWFVDPLNTIIENSGASQAA